jgi:hypothetical protein
MNQAAIKYGDHASTVAVCCNACRTCVQTNLIGLAFAGIGAVGVAIARFGRRYFVKPSY